jgi:hypothetical protein
MRKIKLVGHWVMQEEDVKTRKTKVNLHSSSQLPRHLLDSYLLPLPVT